MPRELAYLWRWYRELERTRQISAHGLQSMTYAEIDAWARLTGRNPMPHEVDGLLALDAAVRSTLLSD